jgi:low affinity Fe/Cu permease
MSARFSRFAAVASSVAGHYLAFLCALTVVIVWAVSGPIFKFSSTWQLIINTGTTIITFLMVFLVQNSQNRDSAAIHIKLDEIINAIKDADDEVISIEEDSDEKLEAMKRKYSEIAAKGGSVSPVK